MIWKQFTHLGNFPPELKSRFNSFLTSGFDDSITVEMQLRSVIKWCQGNFKTVDTLIDFINDISNWLKQFENNFDSKLEDSVITVLSEWQVNGKLDDIINDVLQWQLDDYIATNEQDKLSLTAQLQQNVRQITDLEGYVGYTESDILGIEVDFANSTFTRIAGAVGLTPGASFDVFEPFGGRKRCIITDSGVRLAYFGDVGYTETGKTTTELIVGGVTYPIGTIVQVMVEQPKFYYKVVPLKLDKVQDGKGFHLRKARYYVSAKHKAGFKIHPAFVRNGKEKNFVYLSAYEGAIYDESAGAYILDDAQVADFATDKLSSISGTKPASGVTQNLTRANTRKLAQNRGLGWEQAYGATVAATQLLFAIEYASFNTQTAIGMGVTKTDDATTNMAEPTGATTLLGDASGKAENGSITYRGEENFWMNIWKWVDGLNIEAKGLHNLFVADNAFADDVGTTPYQDAGITLAKTSGYISAFAYNEKFDWLFFPSETSGNSAVPVGDNFYQNNTSNSWLAARLGGTWTNGTTGGGFYWYVHHTASTRTRVICGRLVYVPGVVA